MKRVLFNRRGFTTIGLAAFLAGCQMIPKSQAPTPPPAPTAAPEPTATGLPTDETRHRVALLVPMSGENGEVGQSIANATTMALLDTNAENLRITTYDTSAGAAAAASRALADGNRLILGPLLAEDVAPVLAETRRSGIPLISFSNDSSAVGANVFVMGHVPEQSINRTVAFARSRGGARFAALFPDGDYGARASGALANALRNYGGAFAGSETYTRASQSIVSAAERLRERGGYDTVLIADNPRLAGIAAGELRRDGAVTRILGTELWSGEVAATRAASLRGALFAAVSDQRLKRFSDSYEARFGTRPSRIATLGYDAVLLTLRIARDWRVGRSFPIGQMYDRGGFLGLDGAFRFGPNGVIERALEVREVGNGTIETVSPAPARFED